jgi:hypothetical protein
MDLVVVAAVFFSSHMKGLLEVQHKGGRNARMRRRRMRMRYLRDIRFQ